MFLGIEVQSLGLMLELCLGLESGLQFQLLGLIFS